MSLSEQLTERREGAAKNLPGDIHKIMKSATQRLKDLKIEEQAPKVGEPLKPFLLPNQNGEQRSLESLLEKGKVVLTFYRGGWCPYCNMELRAFQAELDEIEKRGATLVAISPELPNQSLSTSEKNELRFEVLSDLNSEYAKQLGLVFELDESLRPIYTSFGIDVEKHNGKGQFELPIPATFIISQDGTIEYAFVDADYTYRQEPSELVALL